MGERGRNEKWKEIGMGKEIKTKIIIAMKIKIEIAIEGENTRNGYNNKKYKKKYSKKKIECSVHHTSIVA